MGAGRSAGALGRTRKAGEEFTSTKNLLFVSRLRGDCRPEGNHFQHDNLTPSVLDHGAFFQGAFDAHPTGGAQRQVIDGRTLPRAVTI